MAHYHPNFLPFFPGAVYWNQSEIQSYQAAEEAHQAHQAQEAHQAQQAHQAAMLEFSEPNGAYVPNFASHRAPDFPDPSRFPEPGRDFAPCARARQRFFPQSPTARVEQGSGAQQQGSYGATPPKVTVIRREEGNMGAGSRGSPSELSPPGGNYVDSPHSASFTSAQSEMDDIIIDEILSYEEEHSARRRGLAHQGPQLGSSLQTSESRQVAIPSSGSPSSQSEAYYRQVSSSAPTSSFDMDNMVKEEGEGGPEDNTRDRRKKDIHNMIERRRRYNINDRIKELGTMLPKHAAGEDMKLNKGTILKASVDYIRTLQKERETAHRSQVQVAATEAANRAMAAKMREMEAILKRNGLPVPEGPNPQQPSPSSSSGAVYVQTPNGPQRIKEEPREESSPVGWSGSGASPAVASSPSFSTMMGISNLALDPHHTYAASPDPTSQGQSFETELEAAPGQAPGGYNSAVPLPPAQMQELMMDLAGGLEGSKAASPLLHPGDPMLPGGGAVLAPGLSPEVQWDSAAFSPESAPTPQDHNHGMDMSS